MRLPGAGVPAIDEDDVARRSDQIVSRRLPAGDSDAGDVGQPVGRIQCDAARRAGDGNDLADALAGRVDDANVVVAEAGRHRPKEPPVGRDCPAGGEVAESHLRTLWGELATVE